MNREYVISLQPETLASYQMFCRNLVQDPILFQEPSAYKPYHYDPETAKQDYRRHQGRSDYQYYMIYLGDRPIGELVLKKIDMEKRSCELGICLMNDGVKNRGYGTQAEKQALTIAFKKLLLNTVYADTLIHNERSQYVLQKAGFEWIREQNGFGYYRITKEKFEEQNRRESE